MAETLKVLVADDEPCMLAAVERVLRKFTVDLPEVDCEVQFELERADSGEEALEKMERNMPDILLLDYKLPGMSGLDVLGKLNEMGADVLTIMITAYASLDTAVTATKRGAYDFLAKPFTPEELKSTLRKASGRIVLARQAQRLAQEKRQVRFQFISMLAHELKAPLNAVEGYLRILKTRAAGDDPAAYDQMIARSLLRVEGMRKMIADLLDLTRIESGQKKRDLQTIDARAAAADCIENFRPLAEEQRVALELHADQPAPLRADPWEIEMILNNLVSNAIKYNREGGRVDVRVAPLDDGVEIVVADTGIGMTQEEAAKLFNDFVRIKNEKTKNVLGSGLGLSILKKLVALYDGDIDVKSEPDVGSTFRVVLKGAASASDAG